MLQLYHTCIYYNNHSAICLLYLQVLLRELQEAGRVKSHCYSPSPSTEQLNLYWVSGKGDPGSRACTVQSGGSTDCHGSQGGGCETPVGVASARDAVISRPDEDSLEEEKRLKAELASLKEKLHKLTTLKLNENKASCTHSVPCMQCCS